MIKHASSHGLAIFVCTITAGLLVELFKGLLPVMYAEMMTTMSNLSARLGIGLEPTLLAKLAIAVVLGLIWGVGFYIAFKR